MSIKNEPEMRKGKASSALDVLRRTSLKVWQGLRHPTQVADSAFAIRMALIVTLAFSTKCILYNWSDYRLTTYSFAGTFYGARVYWMGHWVQLFAIPLFLSIYLPLIQPRSLIYKCLVPSAFAMTLAVFVAIVNFGPPRPYSGVIQFMGTYCVGIAIATWVHFIDRDALTHQDQSVPASARIEYYKEQANLWRLLVVSGAFGFFWVWPQWWKAHEEIANHLVSAPNERDIVREVFGLHFWMLFAGTILGPIYEGLAKVRAITAQILLVKEKE